MNSAYAIVFLPRDSVIPAVYLLEDPVSDLVRVSEAERQISEAGGEKLAGLTTPSLGYSHTPHATFASDVFWPGIDSTCHHFAEWCLLLT